MAVHISVSMYGNDFAGECGNKECPFLHIDPEKKIKVCQWYDRGFCRHGNYLFCASNRGPIFLTPFLSYGDLKVIHYAK